MCTWVQKKTLPGRRDHVTASGLVRFGCQLASRDNPSIFTIIATDILFLDRDFPKQLVWGGRPHKISIFAEKDEMNICWKTGDSDGGDNEFTICQNLPLLLLILLTMMMKTKMNISWRKWRQGRSWQSWPTLRRCCIFLQTALSLITAKKWKQKWAAKNKGQGLSRRNWKKRAEQDGKYQDGESCWGRTVGGTELNGAGAVCVFLATSRCLFSRLLF